ncbi:flagellar protein FlaG [Pseudidiomarina sp.]|uniref:flagellar protein FlaG n=1 Tax=Pseudidiomarina sp. TaxID=2081707 RepID=UPI003A97F73A
METVNLTSSLQPSGTRPDVPVRSLEQSDKASQVLGGEKAKDSQASLAESANSAVEKFKTLVQDLQRNLDFSVDDSSGQVVVKVMDGESGKLIRQIPSEDLLRLSERLEDMRSLLFKAEA